MGQFDDKTVMITGRRERLQSHRSKIRNGGSEAGIGRPYRRRS